MKNLKMDDYKLGLLSLGAFILFISTVILFKDFGFWKNAWTIQIIFNNAGGLSVGAPIYISGIKGGQVISVNLKEGKALIRIALSRNVVISHNARFGISSLGPMGEKCIDIYYLDEPTKEYIGENETVIGDKPFLAVEIFGELGKLLSDVGESAASIRAIIAMDEGGGDLREILARGRESFEDASSIIKEIKDISGTIKDRADCATAHAVEILKALREEILDNKGKLAIILEDVQKVTGSARDSFVGKEKELGELIEKMASIGNRVDKILNSFDSGDPGGDLRDFITKLKVTGENLENISTEARHMMGDGEIRKNVSNAVNKVSSMATTVDQIFATLNETRFNFDYALRFDEENKLYHSDICLDIIPAREKNLFRVGVEDIGGENDITLQTASKNGYWGKRVGILESRVALGVDYHMTDYATYSMDLIDTRHPYVNLSSRYKLTLNLDLLLSLKKVFTEQNLNVGLVQKF